MKSKTRHLNVFGANVKRLRKQLGISQEELAFRARLHRTYIGGIERGERNVGLSNVVTIAKALGTKATSLLRGVK